MHIKHPMTRPGNSTSSDQATTCYDVIIVGAGLVGCAMARQFTLEGASVLVIEKAADIIDGASKGNSAILHTGFDAPTDSVEQACIGRGYQAFIDLRKKLKLPLLKSGALVLAWTADQADQLDGILEKARSNGVDDVTMLTAKTILKKEPHLSSHVKAGIHVPRECVIDSWTTPFVYMLQAIENGAKLMRRCEVLDGKFDGKQWILNTSRKSVKGTTVINCAGLYGDLLDTQLIGSSAFNIRPRKGQFLVYDNSAYRLLRSIILPVPNEITKGVVICRTVFGKVIVGPTAEEQESRDNASVETSELESLREKAKSIIPALAREPIIASYAGIRPATESKDYCIRHYPQNNYISVGGIRSTGLSAALGIAKRVFDEYIIGGHVHHSPDKIRWPTISQIAESKTRDWQLRGNEGIICHCERVTRREIKTALEGKIPAASLDGLKRRTRVTMGRCQGYYCSAQLSAVTEGRFEQALAFKTTRDDDA
jgi:glycerol-3-phosphate dehydrogenase